MTTLLHLGDFTQLGHWVTVISPSSYHYYSGMGPGMLSGLYRPQELRFNIRKMSEKRGAIFLEDYVTRIDPRERLLHLASGTQVPYDVASFNTGSYVPTHIAETPTPGVFPVKPIINLYDARHRILGMLGRKKLQLVVVGGGPAGVEISANLWRLVRDGGGSAGITLVGGKSILEGSPPRVRELAVSSLLRCGICVEEGAHAESIVHGRVTLSSGTILASDFTFLAVGVKPSGIFRESGLPTDEDGAMLVDGNLRNIAYPEIFGGGDCISLEGLRTAKVGVYAVRQNPVLKNNLMAALEGGSLRTFEPGKSYMLILNMGNNKGILWKNSWIISGRFAFMLKNYIDKRFMRKFQVSGELSEQES